MEVHTTLSTEPKQTNGSLPKSVRLVTVVLSASIALIYLLIGLKVLTVLDNPDDQTAFGLIAAGAFALGALILSRTRARLVFGFGAALVAFVIFTYFSLAAERSPQFETWGIVLRVLQTLLFIGLCYLTFRPPERVGAADLPDWEHPVDETTAGTSAESGTTIHFIPPV